MKRNSFKVRVVAVLAICFSMIPLHAAESGPVRHVSGEIVWVDVVLGKLLLKHVISSKSEQTSEYRITEHDTRVTSPKDRAFFTVKDLQPGQHVTLDVINGKEEKIVQKIVTRPWSRHGLHEAYGEVRSLDAIGTLVLLEKQPASSGQGDTVVEYFFDPKTIIVMKSPGSEPVQLVVKPGDVVKVEYNLIKDKRQAQTVTLYSPGVDFHINPT